MLIDLRTNLSPANLESALFSQRPLVKGGWSSKIGGPEKPLIFNFSRVEWVEPGTVVRCVLLAEAALLSGIDVKFYLPLPYPTSKELYYLKLAEADKEAQEVRQRARHIANAIQRRKNASWVLQHLRLHQALEHHHLLDAPGNLEIIKNYDWSVTISSHEAMFAEHRDEAGPSGPQDRASAELQSVRRDWSRGERPVEGSVEEGQVEGAPWYFKVAYGLQWIANPREAGRQVINHLAEIDILSDVLRHPSGRVAAADGRTLAHVFLKELTENTADHSHREFALVAAWSRPSDVQLKDHEVFEEEKPFALWCRGYPLLEVIVGDSGEGIAKTLLGPYQKVLPRLSPALDQRRVSDRVLAWAFDKWSSGATNAAAKRGTRGLYRVERIVRKYAGCILARSHTSNLVIDCSQGTPRYAPHSSVLAQVPGTVVHIRLPVMPADSMIEVLPQAPLRQSAFHVLNLGHPNRNFTANQSDNICDRVIDLCKSLSATGADSCVIIDFEFASLERRELETLLRDLLEIAHPVAIVIANIQSPAWDSCIETIHSITEEMERAVSRDFASSAATPALSTNAGKNLRSTTAENQGSLDVKDAILFRHAEGDFSWVGVPKNIRPCLEWLWQNGDLSMQKLQELIPSVSQRNEVLRQFSELYHIARRCPDGGLSLLFNQQDVEERLREHLAQEIRCTVNNAVAPEIRKGLYRTPSLELVSKYVDVHRLVSMIGIDRCTRALAERFVSVLTANNNHLSSGGVIEIIADSRTNRHLLSRFRYHLRTLLHHGCAVEINQIGPTDIPVIGPGSTVVVFMDNILSGNLANRLVTQVAQVHHKPIAIVTVLDSRSNRDTWIQQHLHDRSLEHLAGYHLPVVALAEADVTLEGTADEVCRDAASIINISPIDASEEIDTDSVENSYPIDTTTLAEMIQREDALYFDHLVRPNSRHFCFYLDGFRLLGATDTNDPTNLSQTGEEVISQFLKAVLPFANSSGEIVGPICYPSIEGPAAARVIADRLAGAFKTRSYPINRVGLNSEWWFASHLAIPELRQVQLSLFKNQVAPQEQPEVVVVVDWGSVTGKSVRELIRLASLAKPQHIVVVIFLSELPLDEERSIRAIERVRTSNSDGSESLSQVTIHFIARFPIRFYSNLQCPHCQQLNRLNEEERFYQTDLLKSFVKEARLRLRPRSLVDLQDQREEKINARLDDEQHPMNSDTDVSAGNVTASTAHLAGSQPSDVLDIIKFREQVERAVSSTTERYKLLCDLKEMQLGVRARYPEALSRRNNLIRLLSAEWPWLKLEPLTLSCIKPIVADLAAELAMDANELDEVRRDAIIVLRTASKDRFAFHFTDLFKVLVRNHSLVAQLLYCAFTYLQREYLAHHTLSVLVDRLDQTARYARELPVHNSQDLHARLHVAQTVNSLLIQGMSLLHEVRQESASPIQAWRQLKENWVDNYLHEPHHLLAEAIRNLHLGLLEAMLEDPNKEMPVLHWNELRDSWISQERHVLQILALLPAIRSLIDVLPAANVITRQECESLALARTTGVAMVSTLRTQLDLFSDSPRSVRYLGEWEKLKSARDWLFNTLLNPGRKNQGQEKRESPSTLLVALQDCPCDVAQAVNNFVLEPQPYGTYLKVRFDGNLPSTDCRAFCHKTVLMSFLREATRNAALHTKRKSNDAPVNVTIFLKTTESHVQIQITNDGESKQSANVGQGLKRYREYMMAYGGHLIAKPQTDKKVTYVVTVKLPRW
jgi:hypothetical protein